MTDVLLCEYLGCLSKSDSMSLLKLTPALDLYGWTRVLVHGLAFDRDFKWWMGEAWKRELIKWFLGPSGSVLGQFFFQTMSLEARITMVGSEHPFDEWMGRLGRKGVLSHNLGLRVRKMLASAPTALKWGELPRGGKRGELKVVDFDS